MRKDKLLPLNPCMIFFSVEYNCHNTFCCAVVFNSDPIRVIIGLQVLRELSVRVRCWAAGWQLTLVCYMSTLSKHWQLTSVLTLVGLMKIKPQTKHDPRSAKWSGSKTFWRSWLCIITVLNLPVPFHKPFQGESLASQCQGHLASNNVCPAKTLIS